MSAYKTLTTKDVVITPFDANKRFFFVGSEITASNVGIEFYAGINKDDTLWLSSSATESGFVYKENVNGVYNSIKQLYYTNFLSSSWGDLVPSRSLVPGATEEDLRYVGPTDAPRYENYLQSTLTQSRYFPTASNAEISVISIPAKLYGENIIPYTFNFNWTASDGKNFSIIDDGNGNLVSSSWAPFIDGMPSLTSDSIIYGQIFYSHGIAVLTTGSPATASAMLQSAVTIGGYGSGLYGSAFYGGVSNLTQMDLIFSSSFRIYEHQYKCAIRENEFDYSLNPTLLSGSDNDLYYDFATSSYFNPYVTTVGLYNETNDLLLIGKLSQPIPVSRYVDTTIMVNIDF